MRKLVAACKGLRLLAPSIQKQLLQGCAAPGQVQCQCNTRGSLSKHKRAPPQAKVNVTSKSPVGDISVVTLIRTDTTLDHSQKAEEAWSHIGENNDEGQFRTKAGESSSQI